MVHRLVIPVQEVTESLCNEGKKYKKEFYSGYRYTTNNRMELLAVIKALEKLKKINQEVVVFSDSKYVIDAVEKNGF